MRGARRVEAFPRATRAVSERSGDTAAAGCGAAVGGPGGERERNRAHGGGSGYCGFLQAWGLGPSIDCPARSRARVLLGLFTSDGRPSTGVIHHQN